MIVLSALFFSACDKDNPASPSSSAGNGPGSGPAAEPELTITSETTVKVPADGGSYKVTYELLNEVEGGELTAVPSVQWVTDVVRGSGTISFSVLKNLDTEPGEASLAVTYTYGDKEISREVTISQEAGSPAAEYDYDKTIPGFMGVYYGVYGTDSPKFYLALSDMELIGGMMTQDGAMTYMLTFYCREISDITFSEDLSTAYIVPGTYTFGKTGESAAMTIDPSTSVQMPDKSTVSFADGTVVIAQDGDTYTLDAVLVDSTGKTHHIVYTGPGNCMNYAG